MSSYRHHESENDEAQDASAFDDSSVGEPDGGSNVLDESAYASNDGDSPSSGFLHRDHGLELDRLEEQEQSFAQTEIGFPYPLDSDSPLSDGLDGSTHLSNSPLAAYAEQLQSDQNDLADEDSHPDLVEGDSPTVIRGTGSSSALQARQSDSGEPAGEAKNKGKQAAGKPDGGNANAVAAGKLSSANLSTRDLGAALVGTTLQNYRLEEFVGGGGMGAVLRATDLTLGRTVAVKILARSGRNGELEKRFINEAQSAAKLDHEHIARVYNVGEADGLSFIVFEFVEGVNLRDSVINHGPFGIEEVIRFTMQVAEALEHAAERNVIHRDIKPSNIILTSSGKIKLVDMGLARVQRLDADDPELTASGMTLGTFDYLSPEQARDPRQADVRSDLYSLGCTLYFLLTGQPPYPDGGAVEKLLKHRNGKRPDPRKLNPAIPNDLAQAIRRLMSPNPAHRFQTPGELMAVMTMIGRSLGITFSSPFVERALSRYMNRRRGIFAVLPILVPAILLVGGLVFANSFAANRDQSLSPQRPSYEKGAILLRTPKRPATTKANNESTSLVDSVANSNSSVTTEPPNGTATSGVTGADVLAPAPKVGAGDATATPPSTEGAPSTSNSASNTARNGTRTNSNANALPIGVFRNEADEDSFPGSAAFTRVNTQVENAIVGGSWEQGILGSNSIQVASLQELLQRLPRYPFLKNIELAFNGQQTLSQISLQDRQLKISAVEGYRPLIHVDASDASQQAMFTMKGSEVEWVGIDFFWEGANLYGLQSSLFRIMPGPTPSGDVPRLNFADCTITIFDDRQSFIPPDLAVIEVQKGKQSVIESERALQIIEPPSISLLRTSVRGPVKMIRVPEATAFHLSWVQGLFVTSNRLIEAQGTIKNESGFRMRAALTNVTIAAEKGLARFAVKDELHELLRFELDAQNCIFDTPRAKAFVEHVVGEFADESQLLLISSIASFFPDRVPLWELQGISDRFPLQQVFIEEANLNEDWFDVDRVELARLIEWRVAEEDRPTRLDQRRLSDYLLKADPTSPAFFTSAGFSNVALRAFPVLPQRN